MPNGSLQWCNKDIKMMYYDIPVYLLHFHTAGHSHRCTSCEKLYQLGCRAGDKTSTVATVEVATLQLMLWIWQKHWQRHQRRPYVRSLNQYCCFWCWCDVTSYYSTPPFTPFMLGLHHASYIAFISKHVHKLRSKTSTGYMLQPSCVWVATSKNNPGFTEKVSVGVLLQVKCSSFLNGFLNEGQTVEPFRMLYCTLFFFSPKVQFDLLLPRFRPMLWDVK